MKIIRIEFIPGYWAGYVEWGTLDTSSVQVSRSVVPNSLWPHEPQHARPQRLLIFLPAILIPACASSSPAFLMMYSAYKLNKQGEQYTALTYSFSYLEPVCCSMSSSNCWFLTCIQVSQEAGSGDLVCPSLSEFSTVYCDPHSQRLWHSQYSRNRCFWNSLAFSMIQRMLANLISGSSAFSKLSLNIWLFMVHILLKPFGEFWTLLC